MNPILRLAFLALKAASLATLEAGRAARVWYDSPEVQAALAEAKAYLQEKKVEAQPLLLPAVTRVQTLRTSLEATVFYRLVRIAVLRSTPAKVLKLAAKKLSIPYSTKQKLVSGGK